MNSLLTGASGFLGSRILRELTKKHTVTTVGRTPLHGRHIRCDLAQAMPTLPNERFDLIVHCAGKAHSVARNPAERADYDRVNVQGTVRLLKALDLLPVLPDGFVHISSVLVYGRSEGDRLTEETPLTATDPYGFSKVSAEAVVREWAVRTGVRLTVLRLPLVVAEPPTGNVASLQKAIRRGYYVRMGDGLARRSMVRADDVSAVIERAAAVGGTFNLTDGCQPTVRELEQALAQQAGSSWSIPVISIESAKIIARVGDGFNAVVGRWFPFDSTALQKLTSTLTFSDEKARQQLNWSPRPALDVFA